MKKITVILITAFIPVCVFAGWSKVSGQDPVSSDSKVFVNNTHLVEVQADGDVWVVAATGGSWNKISGQDPVASDSKVFVNDTHLIEVQADGDIWVISITDGSRTKTSESKN